MAKFLNTSATNYHLEELIKNAQERLILISPFLQMSDRIKELLEDKNRLKMDVRILYGKSKLKSEEEQWLQQMEYIRLSFCKNLHAKCYLSEHACIITSLNLYQFSQVNNNEMGILIERGSGGIFGNNPDNQLYDDAYEEVQRLIRIGEEVRATKTTEATKAQKERTPETSTQTNSVKNFDKLTTAKLAKQLNVKTVELKERLVKQGYIELRKGNPYLTPKGKEVGAEFRKGSGGYYFLWPKDFTLNTTN